MLVKFLSFVISVIGTARYKTVMLSCIALILSMTGITALVLKNSGGQAKDAASTVQQQKDGVDSQSFTPQIHANRQSAKDNPQNSSSSSSSQTQNTSNNSQSAESSDNNSAASSKPSAANAFDFTVSKSSLTLAADATSDPITLTTSDNSSVTWQIVADNGTNDAQIIANQTTGATTSFQIQAAHKPVDSTFKVTVTVRDTTRNINLSKTITVTVQ